MKNRAMAGLSMGAVFFSHITLAASDFSGDLGGGVALIKKKTLEIRARATSV